MISVQIHSWATVNKTDYYNELFVKCSFLYVETKNHRAVINCTVFVNIDIIYNLIPDLGDICEIDNDCTKRIKNAKCTGMTCVCIDTYYELNKQCVPGNFDFHCCTFKRYHFLSKHTRKSEILLKLSFFQVSIPVVFLMLVVYQKIQYANRMIAFVRNSTWLNQPTRVFKVRTFFKIYIKM